MKPYANFDIFSLVCNYSFSQARRLSENIFGIVHCLTFEKNERNLLRSFNVAQLAAKEKDNIDHQIFKLLQTGAQSAQRYKH